MCRNVATAHEPQPKFTSLRAFHHDSLQVTASRLVRRDSIHPRHFASPPLPTSRTTSSTRSACKHVTAGSVFSDLRIMRASPGGVEGGLGAGGAHHLQGLSTQVFDYSLLVWLPGAKS